MKQILAQVTNLATNSAVLYEQYPYNSFAEFGGKYLAAGPDGLFQIDVGDTDTSAPIVASIKTGQTSFGSEFQKHLTSFYAGMRSAGDVAVRVFVDERDPIEYVLSPLDIATLKQRRSIMGKGMRGKYWAFEIENTGGCDFDLDTMNVGAVVSARRI